MVTMPDTRVNPSPAQASPLAVRNNPPGRQSNPQAQAIIPQALPVSWARPGTTGPLTRWLAVGVPLFLRLLRYCLPLGRLLRRRCCEGMRFPALGVLALFDRLSRP